MVKSKQSVNPFPSYDPSDIAAAFQLKVNKNCSHLENWLQAPTYELQPHKQAFFEDLAADATIDASYWNEEELKIKLIGTLFRIAEIEVPEQVKVFFERSISATVQGYDLAVKADCIVATPLPFNKPTHPYFFLQEFKKKRGEKNDPEGQLLCAMLIAQELNQDNKPIYGGYLFGSVWNFATLLGNDYCCSREFNATNRQDLLQIVFILRHLKELILNRQS